MDCNNETTPVLFSLFRKKIVISRIALNFVGSVDNKHAFSSFMSRSLIELQI